MGMFDNIRAAKEMMKNMSPDQMKDLMGQAQNYQQQMNEMIRQAVADEIQKRGLVTRSEVEKMIQK